MKKKTIFGMTVAVLLILTLMIPQVSTFTMSALSVFRVGDTKTITITLDDIGEMVRYAEIEKDKILKQQIPNSYEKLDHPEKEYRTLTDIKDFTAFSVNLPIELKDTQPELLMTDIMEKSFIMENGDVITIAVSPTLVANYKNLTFISTQGVNNNIPIESKTEMLQKLINAPMLPQNIRSQLAEIDPNTKDIYLPVVVGVSRETDLGGTTGYIYSTDDMQSFLSVLPAELISKFNENLTTSEYTNTSILIWTKNSVLYALIGNLSDSKLTKIARSVR